MTIIDSITLDVADPAAADAFLAAAFGLGDRIRTRAGDPGPGFRGFTLSLVVAQPSTVDALAASALDAGATVVKPVTKSFWGYGGVLRAPDGTLWKLASSSRKETGPATREIQDVVLLLGADDVKASKRFYSERGLAVARSFGSKYVEFATTGITLALYGHRALAKDAGVPADRPGVHGLTIDGDAGAFADPDGLRWGRRVS